MRNVYATLFGTDDPSEWNESTVLQTFRILYPASHMRYRIFYKKTSTLNVQSLSLASNLDFLIQGGAAGAFSKAARKARRRASRAAPVNLGHNRTKDFMDFTFPDFGTG